MDGLNHLPDLELMERGGWQSKKATLRYRKASRYLLALNRLSKEQQKAARTAPQCILKLLSQYLEEIGKE